MEEGCVQNSPPELMKLKETEVLYSKDRRI
jgi:hypothetical protein